MLSVTAGPCSLVHRDGDTGRDGVPMNVLISDDSSLFSCRLAGRLLRDGHRVTLMQHVDQELQVPANNSRTITDLVDELFAAGDRFSIRHTRTCNLSTVPPFSHVVFVTTALQGSGSPRVALVRHSLLCLSTLLEATKRDAPPPTFTLVANDRDALSGDAKLKFDSVMDTAMEAVLHMHRSLYSTTVINVKLSPGVGSQLSPIDEEVTESIVVAMQKGSWCEDKHVVGDVVDNVRRLSNTYLAPWVQFLSWKAPTQSPKATPAAEEEEEEEEEEEGEEEEEEEEEDVVFTTYLSSKVDPQRKIFIEKDTYGYVMEWHQSMRDIGVKAVVFHDGLSPEFRCVRCFPARWFAPQVQVYGINLRSRERTFTF